MCFMFCFWYFFITRYLAYSFGILPKFLLNYLAPEYLQALAYHIHRHTTFKKFIKFMVQATALLQKNLENAKASLEVLVADLQFLRDQVTITQVVLISTLIWDIKYVKTCSRVLAVANLQPVQSNYCLHLFAVAFRITCSADQCISG